VSTALRRAAYGRLSGDTTLNGYLGGIAAGYTKAIYYEVVPEDAGFPCVVFSKQSGVSTGSFRNRGTATVPEKGPVSAYDTDVWLFKAIDRSTTADTAEQISSRIAALLNDGGTAISLSPSAGTLLYFRRESDIDYSEVVDGETYRHSGSLYRVIVEPT
jgi:hypothetical protein